MEKAKLWGGFAIAAGFVLIGLIVALSAGWNPTAIALICGGGLVALVQTLLVRRSKKRRG